MVALVNTPSAATRTTVRIWDLPTRVFHWVLAASVIGSLVSGTVGGKAMVAHFWFGYIALGLLAFRLVWGFAGGRWSRFASFVHPPAALLRYLRGERRDGEHLDAGHSPLGAGSVFAMLAVLIVQVGTGLIADDEISERGPLNKYVSGATAVVATAWHKNYGRWIVLALVVLHVGAIAFYRLRHRRDLVGPMWHGDKSLGADVPASRDDARTRTLALVLALAAAAGVAWVMRQGG
ncbi:MAG: cytochrome b/b6 domain-containing protein [Rubrivivax sp.]|nr:cytochrome b/b6 domain-containing protein [Rubrivivax sp.]